MTRWIIICTILLALCALVTWHLTTKAIHARITAAKPQLQLFQAEFPPTTDAGVPSNQNAALVYQRIFPALFYLMLTTDSWTAEDDTDLLTPDGEITQAGRDLLESDYIPVGFIPNLELAAAMPDCQFDPVGTMTVSTLTTERMSCARLSMGVLHLLAAVAIEDGDLDQALRHYETAIALGLHTARRGVMLDLLTGASIAMATLDRLDALELNALSEAQRSRVGDLCDLLQGKDPFGVGLTYQAEFDFFLFTIKRHLMPAAPLGDRAVRTAAREWFRTMGELDDELADLDLCGEGMRDPALSTFLSHLSADNLDAGLNRAAQPYRDYLTEIGAKWDRDAQELEATTERFYADNPGWSTGFVGLEAPASSALRARDQAKALKDRLEKAAQDHPQK